MVWGAFGSGKESSSGMDEGDIMFMYTDLDVDYDCIIQGEGYLSK